jgi:hypothetical protein
VVGRGVGLGHGMSACTEARTEYMHGGVTRGCGADDAGRTAFGLLIGTGQQRIIGPTGATVGSGVGAGGGVGVWSGGAVGSGVPTGLIIAG